MATHSSILARKIPWTEEPASYSPWGHKESHMTERLQLFLSPSLPPYGTGRGICLLPGQGVEGVFISSSEISSSASALIGSSYHTLCLPPAQGSPVVKAAGRLLSQCRHWERQKQETNCFSSTNIFSFLLLKLDGRPHGEVKRATFSSKDSCSLPGGRS